MVDKQYVVTLKELTEMIRRLQTEYKNTLDMVPENLVAHWLLKGKTPIEPLNRDSILGELKEFFNETGLMPSVEVDQLEDLADTISYLIPTPIEPSKQFNEAEIRDILETEISVTVHGDAYADIYIEDAVKELSTLTPKDNIKESKGTKGYHDVDKYYQD